MVDSKLTAVLLLSCPDRRGLVSKITNFIYERSGNIIDLDEHVDPDEQMFSIRAAWDMKEFSIAPENLKETFDKLAEEFDAEYQIHFLEHKSRVAVFVSKYDHCLNEILWRYNTNEYPFEIPLIISNHPDLKPLADQNNIPFYHIPITKENKTEQEELELKLLEEHKIDTVVLARYMQVLTGKIIKKYPNRIINIHHSFLPAFVGSNPYRQAYDRGVKIIGATSHYVTEVLDDGPIIEQDIAPVSHKDSLQELKHKGRDLERLVLARAMIKHIEHRVLARGRKTIVFH